MSRQIKVATNGELVEEELADIMQEESDKQYGRVDHPSYYNQGDIECIDAMIAAKGIEKVKAYCECCAFKYSWRLGLKDAISKETTKIKWYLDKFLELSSQ